jgi:hypothetical protein
LGETKVFPREGTVVRTGSVGKTEELAKTNKKETKEQLTGFLGLAHVVIEGMCKPELNFCSCK